MTANSRPIVRFLCPPLMSPLYHGMTSLVVEPERGRGSARRTSSEGLRRISLRAAQPHAGDSVQTPQFSNLDGLDDRERRVSRVNALELQPCLGK
jgi:hypothetical protein